MMPREFHSISERHRVIGRWTRRVAWSCAGLAVLVSATGCPPPPAVQATPRERSRLSIVKQADSLTLNGIEPIQGFARGRDCTFVHCLELVLHATGRRIGYDELMGISGMAFRLQFNVSRWDVGNPDPLVGDDCMDNLFTAVGWDYEIRIVRQEELAERDALRKAVKQSLDRGIPVLASNIIPPEDWGLITGYRSDQTWLCRSYNGSAEREDKPAVGWPTAVVLLTRKLRLPDLHEAHDASIREAVTGFSKRHSDSYALGDRAFEEWCRSLRSAQDRRYIHANFWTYIGLIDARGAAVRYLRSIANEFGPRAVHINKAADWYDKEVRLLLDGLKHVPAGKLYPHDMPPAEMRNAQIEVLHQAQKMENIAIESLRKAI